MVGDCGDGFGRGDVYMTRRLGDPVRMNSRVLRIFCIGNSASYAK